MRSETSISSSPYPRPPDSDEAAEPGPEAPEGRRARSIGWGGSWTRALILPLLLALLETSWVSAWLAMIGVATGGEGGRPVIGPVTAVAVMLLAWALVRLLIWYRADLALLRWVVVATGIVCFLLVVKYEQYPQVPLFDGRWLGDLIDRVPEAMFTAPFAAIAITIYLWWRGEQLAQGEVSFEAVQNRFRIGLAAVALCLLVMPVVARGELLAVGQAAVSSRVFLFIIVSLIALPLSRLETVRLEATATDPTVASFHRHWVVTVFGAVLGLWGFTLVVAHVLDFDLGAVLASPLAVLGEVVDFVLRILIWPLSLFVDALVYFLRLITRGRGDVEWQGPPPSLKPEDLPTRELPISLSPEVVRALEYTAALALIAIVLYILWRAVARPRWLRGPEEVSEARDSVWSWSAFRNGLLDGMRGLAGRLGRRRADSLPPLEGPPGVRTVREAYRSLLQLGTELEAPRRAEATPYEYQQQIGTILPLPVDLRVLTEAYVGARYSSHQPEDGQVMEAQAAWERIRQAGATLLRERQRQREEAEGL